jgi:hypothetical protein
MLKRIVYLSILEISGVSAIFGQTPNPLPGTFELEKPLAENAIKTALKKK